MRSGMMDRRRQARTEWAAWYLFIDISSIKYILQNVLINSLAAL